MADYYSIITNRGKELEAEALASGRLIVLTHFVVGDSNGKQVKPDPAQIRLINETYRGDIAELVVSPEQSTQLMAKIVLPTGIGGFTVREVGLMTDAGELYAVANCPSIDKPVGGVSVNMQFRLAVSDTSNITLNVATGDGLFLRIDQNLKEIKARGAEAQKTSRESIGVLDGTTQQRGLVQLNSNVNSTSETQAATPAAVKIVMDNANARLAKDRNGADIPNVALFLQNVGLGETINLAAGALQKDQNGTDILDKKRFARTIGAVISTNITFNDASGWYKIATVVMPQATSTAVIKLYGGAGFNAGSPEQAAISELVLRAGNGSPVGITATLWRRSPAAANEVAWVNTSGDTYDIYINIGQYAYWLIAQYDYTGNANVTLHSTPEYSSVQPGNSTSGQTYTIYSSLMKPTAGDVGALPITGGQLNGPLGIGTDNALGGNSIVLGDNDTGIKWHSDGVLGLYANNALVGYIDNSGLHMSVDVLTNGAVRAGDGKKLSLTSNNNSTMTATFNLWGDANRPTVIELDDDQGWHLYSQRNPDGSIVFTVNGDITANTLRAGGAIYQNNGDIFGSVWGNSWLSLWINNNFVADVQLGAGTSVTTWNNAGSWPNTPGYVVTSVWKDAQGENIDGINYAPLQKRVGNQWYTVQGGTV
ncbi:phage tail protein [Salmonella enterica]|nr:phage tail protein [Salmonella enterica]ECO4614820.1 phage tail protein [Salmonella enterica]ECV6984697.1 phage tail protein [Salmonella enterica]ECY0894439.1 phage tail protein [Salmonella enterica]EDF4876998.1 phage tail protein [Salmonella enterica]